MFNAAGDPFQETFLDRSINIGVIYHERFKVIGEVGKINFSAGICDGDVPEKFRVVKSLVFGNENHVGAPPVLGNLTRGVDSTDDFVKSFQQAGTFFVREVGQAVEAGGSFIALTFCNFLECNEGGGRYGMEGGGGIGCPGRGRKVESRVASR